MKNGLPIKPLQTLCDDFKQDIVDGPFGSELQRKDYITKGVPVLKIQNVKPFAIELKKMDYVSPAKFQELRRHSYRSGDIVMTKLGSPLGVSAIVEDLDEGVIVADLVRIRAQRINTKYLCYHLNSQRTNDFINSMQKGTTRPRVTLSVVRELPIYVPPLPEQQRIVGILDEAFEGIATATANAEKNLQNARTLFESHLQSVFTQRGKGWVVRSISEIAKHSLGKMLDKAKNKGERQPYLRNSNVRWFTFDLSDLLQMPFLPQEAEKYTAVKGDVLICEGGYPGRAAIWNEEYPIYFQKALHRVRFHEPEHNKWFVYYLFAQDKSGELKQHFSGTGIQHFTGEVLARFQLPLPPLSELRRAVARFEELSAETQRLESIYQQKLAALDHLKKSLLHQAFSGQLTRDKGELIRENG
jgi:type I restriction enzyme S subunit